MDAFAVTWKHLTTRNSPNTVPLHLERGYTSAMHHRRLDVPFSNCSDDSSTCGLHSTFLLATRFTMKPMLPSGEDPSDDVECLQIEFGSACLRRLECFCTLTDGGKKMDSVDDRLRGVPRSLSY